MARCTSMRPLTESVIASSTVLPSGDIATSALAEARGPALKANSICRDDVGSVRWPTTQPPTPVAAAIAAATGIQRPTEGRAAALRVPILGRGVTCSPFSASLNS